MRGCVGKTLSALFALSSIGSVAENSSSAAHLEAKTLLEKLTEDHSTIESFLSSADFSQSHRRDFYALKRSISLQPAKLLKPRIISFGPNRESILSFNGGLPGDLDPDGQENRAIELMVLNKADQKYDFYHISYPAQASGEKPHVMGPNPEICLECHTNRMPFLKAADTDILSAEEVRTVLEFAKSQPAGAAEHRYLQLIGEGLVKNLPQD